MHYGAQFPAHPQQSLQALIDQHFELAYARVDSVYQRHFASPRAVLARHWRHKRDIPADLLALPRSLWSLARRHVLRRLPADSRLNGKAQELQTIIQQELLDLPTLECALQDYTLAWQQQFEHEFNAILESVPLLQREAFAHTLAQRLERLSLPSEGAREALTFLLMGIVGKSLGAQVAFGSALATGQAVAVTLYTSQLSWWGSLWVSLSGVPGWVSLAGMSGGVLASLLAAPLLAPWLEVGVNRVRAQQTLRHTVDSAYQALSQPAPGVLDAAGRLGVYLQALPDVLHLAAGLARQFR